MQKYNVQIDTDQISLKKAAQKFKEKNIKVVGYLSDDAIVVEFENDNPAGKMNILVEDNEWIVFVSKEN